MSFSLYFLYFATSGLIYSTPVVGRFNGGYASREQGICGPGEVSCGTRGPGFVACCPSGTYCLNPLTASNHTDNTGCCPTDEDCSNAIEYYNVCADGTWNLYNTTDALPFCCLSGYRGAATSQYDVCRAGALQSGETSLPAIPQGIITTSSSNLPTSSPSPSTTSPPDSRPPTNTSLGPGVIAGITVGSIAGLVAICLLAWYFGRKAGIKLGSSSVQVGGIDDGLPLTYPEHMRNNKPPHPQFAEYRSVSQKPSRAELEG
ncbi:hypothetical protein AA313_de0205900 [Arthrobotrys entomopaga]|nr:hypothetical protein AA313_de0205900 [Arthrobotrys entomopaga]